MSMSRAKNVLAGIDELISGRLLQVCSYRRNSGITNRKKILLF